MHLSHALSDQIKPGGNIVLSRLDHNANVGPWSRLAAQRGCEVRWVPFCGETYDLDMQQLERLVDQNTRLVAVGMAANSIGTVNDIRHVCKIAREHGTPSLHRTRLVERSGTRSTAGCGASRADAHTCRRVLIHRCGPRSAAPAHRREGDRLRLPRPLSVRAPNPNLSTNIAGRSACAESCAHRLRRSVKPCAVDADTIVGNRSASHCSYKFFGPHMGMVYGREPLLRALTPAKLPAAADELPSKAT